MHTDDYEKRFYIWAYGTSHKLSYIEKMKYWNILHGESLMLFPGGSVIKDMEKMYDLFDIHLEKLDVEAKLYRTKNEI